MVVIGIAVVTDTGKLIAQRKGESIFSGLLEAPCADFGNQTVAVGIFTVGGGNTPQRAVIVVKNKAAVCHFIKGRGKFGVNGVG